MDILLVYGTYSGGTLHAAEIIQDELQSKGHHVELQNVWHMEPDKFNNYSLIICGTNSWFEQKQEGQMNGGYHALKPKTNENTLHDKKVAVYGLGDSHQYNATFCEGATHLEEFVRSMGGSPIIDTLRIDRFYFEKDHNSHVVRDWATKISTLIT